MSDADTPQFQLGALFEQAQKMGEQLAAAQDQLASSTFVGQSGGGAVKITVTGAMEFVAVELNPAAVDPNDVEMLQDLILAALHDATHQVNAAQPDVGGLAGLDLGQLGLGGLLGGGSAE